MIHSEAGLSSYILTTECMAAVWAIEDMAQCFFPFVSCGYKCGPEKGKPSSACEAQGHQLWKTEPGLSGEEHRLMVGQVTQGSSGKERDVVRVTPPSHHLPGHRKSLPPISWDFWGPVVGVGWRLGCGPQSLPHLLSWLALKAALGRRQQSSAFVGGWIGARGAGSQIEWEGDNLFF